jgi:FADH2 O2-dependent halogenase
VRADFDIAVIGSGFAGSLMAMIARRLGRSVVLLERGRHPRFAIGESSTPLANLLLEELARAYGLPMLLSLCKWGPWQRTYPHIACGKKRGFTFLHHTAGRPFAGRESELLVAASPHDGIADTHWYRADFDAFLVAQAQALGVEFLDETEATLFSLDDGVRFAVTRGGERRELHAHFLIDASGPRGFMHRALGLAGRPFAHMPTTQSLFAHFENVARWDALHAHRVAPPFPPDDAAMHHVFDGGWIWELRFNNGVTSAGVVATDALAAELRLSEGSRSWERLLSRLPSVREQFADAKATMPFIHLPRVVACSSEIVGENWALLPSAAGFIDPLLSTGFPLTLLGVLRLAEAIGSSHPFDQLKCYRTQTFRELETTAYLVAALYANLRDFEVFSALTLLYFAAASYTESAHRLGRPHLARGFLLCDEPRFGAAFHSICEAALDVAPNERTALVQRIYALIEPFDVIGLSDRERHPWYPCLATDFLDSAHKLHATHPEAEAALARAGFTG